MSARDRIVEAANELFYREGIRAVSVDAISARAGITKPTFYYHFKSKDDVIEAYLAARDQPNLREYEAWFDAAQGGAAERVGAIFAGIAGKARQSKWRGCGFLRVVAELAGMPGHPAIRTAARHKSQFEEWLAARLAAEGLQEPAVLAREIALLMDGAFSAMLTHSDSSYAESAGTAAKKLINQAFARQASTTALSAR